MILPLLFVGSCSALHKTIFLHSYIELWSVQLIQIFNFFFENLNLCRYFFLNFVKCCCTNTNTTINGIVGISVDSGYRQSENQRSDKRHGAFSGILGWVLKNDLKFRPLCLFFISICLIMWLLPFKFHTLKCLVQIWIWI